MSNIDNRPMLNAYPDSIGGTLKDIVSVLNREELRDAFGAFYILPSIFNTDLDRGFSVIDYNINEQLASEEDIEVLRTLGIDLKLDFILNHASVLSEQFQDVIRYGAQSKYRDFFIDWNQFWEGCGDMTDAGYIQPREELIKDMFFRKPGLPILMVRFPDGREVPYWNTFYQEVRYKPIDTEILMQHINIQYLSAKKLVEKVNAQIQDGKKPKDIDFSGFEKYKDAVIELLESERSYLGQMDLNIKSPLVWEFYQDTLKRLSTYGAKIVRLDAFAYAPKEPGEKNFLNDPGTWDLLEKIKEMADQYNVTLLPEIHASYDQMIYELVSKKGYMTYDFFLPGLLIYAMEKHDGQVLVDWANEILNKDISVVNMLGCHDGIPLLDLKGILSDEEISELINIIVKRGGYVKDLHGQKNVYYQVNATYYSALGEDDKKMLFARAIHMFMPGKPQVWYLDLFAGKNDYEAVKRAGEGGHKEINRTNLNMSEIETALTKEVVKQQIELIRFRNTCVAFGKGSSVTIKKDGNKVYFCWSNHGVKAALEADFETYEYRIYE